MESFLGAKLVYELHVATKNHERAVKDQKKKVSGLKEENAHLLEKLKQNESGMKEAVELLKMLEENKAIWFEATMKDRMEKGPSEPKKMNDSLSRAGFANPSPANSEPLVQVQCNNACGRKVSMKGITAVRLRNKSKNSLRRGKRKSTSIGHGVKKKSRLPSEFEDDEGEDENAIEHDQDILSDQEENDPTEEEVNKATKQKKMSWERKKTTETKFPPEP